MHAGDRHTGPDSARGICHRADECGFLRVPARGQQQDQQDEEHPLRDIGNTPLRFEIATEKTRARTPTEKDEKNGGTGREDRGEVTPGNPTVSRAAYHWCQREIEMSPFLAK